MSPSGATRPTTRKPIVPKHSPNTELVAMLKALAVPLAQALGAGNEVVVHDLSRVPNSIVAIGGELTGRRVGGPMTDLLLRHLRQDHTDNLLRYRTKTPR